MTAAVSLSIETSLSVNHDEDFSALNRQATQAKKAGEMERAVRLLRQAKTLHGEHYQDTRLAKVLQAAGRLDEALAEIQWLIDHSATLAKAMFAHQPPTVLLQQKTHWLARIHRDAALICKRAKRSDLQAHHEQRCQSLLALVEKLRPVADADQAARARKWDQAKAQGREAMEALLRERAEVTERNRR